MIVHFSAPCSTIRFHLVGIRPSKFFNPGICRVLPMHAYVLLRIVCSSSAELCIV